MKKCTAFIPTNSPDTLNTITLNTKGTPIKHKQQNLLEDNAQWCSWAQPHGPTEEFLLPPRRLWFRTQTCSSPLKGCEDHLHYTLTRLSKWHYCPPCHAPALPFWLLTGQARAWGLLTPLLTPSWAVKQMPHTHARNFRSPEAAIQTDLLSYTHHVLLCTTVTNIMMLNSSESVLAM